MTSFETSRRYRLDPATVERPETWRRASAQTELVSNAVVITVAGEIDATNSTPLASYIEQRGAVAGRLYLDLRDVTFFATAGLAVLRRLEHQFELIGTRWHLLAGPAVRKVLRICDAGDLPQLDSLDGLRGPRTLIRG
jgi:anti-anti-sigma factor